MAALRSFAITTLLLIGVLPASGGSPRFADPGNDSLFVQSAASVLNRNFTGSDLSYLLLDARSGRLVASRWDDPNRPIPLGSLVKPFTAIAYGEQNGYRYPSHVCHGTVNGCWLPRGHGQINLTSAIEYSCNSYFQQLAAGVTAQNVSTVATRFGVEAPENSATASTFVGIGDAWPISPLRMAHAYLELIQRRDQPGIHEIVEGMALSAQQGTGAAVDRALVQRRALVKTGTAPCTHRDHAPGDGFVITLFPADDPRILLLLRVHGAPGAQAAAVAGDVLKQMGE